MHIFLKVISLLFTLTLLPPATLAVNVPIGLFPIENYSQNISDWIKPSAADYNQPLITAKMQQQRFEDFYNHTFATGTKGATSPWDHAFVEHTLQQIPNLQQLEQKMINNFSNKSKDKKNIGYGMNFRKYEPYWIRNISTNMHLEQFTTPLAYNKNNRAIASKNLLARLLPTNDPYYYHFTLPGQGYPFDNLQESAVWVGTPLYVLGQTLDAQWALVLTPHLIAWVETQGVAYTNPQFISRWQQQAHYSTVAITRTNTSIFDTKGKYCFNTYVGTVFPGIRSDPTHKLYKIMIPKVKTDGASHPEAVIDTATLTWSEGTAMPLAATPHNFANIIATLINRTYGWGTMNFYNDCSAELQSLFTPFAIWLPRHSSAQTSVARIVDKSSANLNERLAYLTTHGKKLITIIYVGGHVILYVGNTNNTIPASNQPIAISYQNSWALSPADKNRRAVIGKAVFLPLLKTYPEDSELVSHAGLKYFQLGFLDDFPEQHADMSQIILHSLKLH